MRDAFPDDLSVYSAIVFINGNATGGGRPMPQVWIEIEENENCGYHPQQVFERQGPDAQYPAVLVESLPGVEGAHEVTGWSAGGRCAVTLTVVGDSGAGQSILVWGGDAGVRLRPSGSKSVWSLEVSDQFGEPYLLLPRDAAPAPLPH